MNSIKIEKGAVEAVKRTIRLHDKMTELIKEDDKDPVWDGNIYTFYDSDLKSEHIQYTIPTQIKGKNDNSLLRRKSITYPVEYKNLRNYFNHGGVCYFVVVISDDGEKVSIFYNALTPIKLQSLLKGTEKKKPGQTKNITLMRLKNNDKDELYKILLQFGHDSKEQGSGELVRKSISANDLGNVDSIRMTAFASENKEVLRNVKDGEVCLFGHMANADIWLPISYDTQKHMEISACVKRNETFGVDKVVYYKGYEVRENFDNALVIQLSENVIINLSEKKMNFMPKSEVEQIVKDIQFLEAFQQGTSLYIGKNKFTDYGKVRYDEELKRVMNDFKQIQLATSKFGISLNKRVEDFTDSDWNAVNELLRLYQGKRVPQNEIAWYVWWWQGKVVPFVLVQDESEVLVENMFHAQQLRVTASGKEGEYRVPVFINFQRDVWEKLYDVPEEDLLDELEKGEYNKETEGNFSLLLVEILSAYDTTGSEKYYDMARVISDKLLGISPDNDYWRINKLQLLRRKRELSEEEFQELERIENDSDDKKVVCATNILLDNKRQAKRILNEMDEEDRKLFMTYPIYNLL